MSKMRTCLFLFLICMYGGLFGIDDSHCKIAKAPSWIKEVAYDTKTANSKQEDDIVHYLLFNVQVDLDRLEKFTQIVMHLETIEAVQQNSLIELEFDPAYETIILHKLCIHRNESCIDKIVTSQQDVIQPEKESDDYQYSGRKEWVILLDDVQKGDVIEYSYSRVGWNPAFKGMYNDEFYLQTYYPLKEAFYRIVGAQNRTLYFKSHGTSLVPSHNLLNDGRQEWSWNVTDVGPYQADASMPSWHAALPLLQVTEFLNWAALAQWGSNAFTLPREYSPEMQQLVHQWQEKSADDEERIMQALRFVQQEIRYLGLEMGSNTHEPEDPNVVLQRRYGDCKDKTLLLKAFLAQMGIDSDPVLVSSWLKGRINEWLPSIDIFDHVILQISKQGSFFWVDPTLSNQECPSLIHNSCAHYEKGLVLNSKTTDPTIMPADVHSKVVVNTKFVVGSLDEPALFEKKVTYFGKEAERLRGVYRQFGHRDIEKYYDDEFGELFGTLEKRAPLQVQDDETKNAFSFIFKYTLHELWQENDVGQEYHFSVFPDHLINSLDFAINPARQSPLALDYPVHIIEYATIIDRESDWDKHNLKKTLETKDMAFHFAKKSEGNRLKLRYELKIKQDHVPIERIGEHRKNMQMIEDLLFTKITYPMKEESVAVLLENDNYYLLGGLTFFYAGLIYLLTRKPKRKDD